MKSIRKIGLVFVGSVAFGLSAGAAADSEYALSYTTDELATQQGVQAVHARIVQTARQSCPAYAEIRSVERRQNCVSEVTSDLVSKVAHPGLTQFHENPEAVSVAVANDTAADRS